MRTVLLTLAFSLLTGVLFSQTSPGSIYSIVSGDHVVISQDNAIRNCAFSPNLENITLNNDVINWFQVDTLNETQRCYCTFNYQIEIDFLNSGNYIVNVYSVYLSDTTFEGTTTFSIGPSFKSNMGLIFRTSATDCLTYMNGSDNLEYHLSNDNLIFVHQNLIIKKISIFSLTGLQLQSAVGNSYSCKLPVAFLKNGIYLAVIETGEGQISRKISIFR